MAKAKNPLSSWWTAFRARRRENAQIRRQKANERAESPYRERPPRGHSDNVIGSDGGGI